MAKGLEALRDLVEEGDLDVVPDRGTLTEEEEKRLLEPVKAPGLVPAPQIRAKVNGSTALETAEVEKIGNKDKKPPEKKVASFGGGDPEHTE